MTGWLLTGGALGILNFVTQRWTVARLHPSAPRRAVAWAVGGALLRWALTAGLLFVALRQGAWPALLAFAGLWLARWGTVCRSHQRPPPGKLFDR